MSNRRSDKKRRHARPASPPIIPLPAPWPGWAIPAAIVGGALLVRLLVLAQLGSDPLLQPRGLLDDAVYVKLAMRVAAGDLMLRPDVYYLSPFYTYFLGLIFAVTGGSVAIARLVQVMLGAATVGLIGLAATSLWSRRAGIVAAILAAGTGLFAFNEILILQSSIDPFLTAVALVALIRALRRESLAAFVVAGLALGALSLNRPNTLPVIAVVALAWVLLQFSRAAVIQAAALVLGAALCLAPFTIRNRMVAGEWVLVTSHGGLNFFIGNHAGADGTWSAVPGVRGSIDGQKDDVRKVAGAALGRPVSASEASTYFYGQSWTWMRSHPIDWARLLARKIALTFNSTDVALNYSYTYFVRDEPGVLTVLAVGPWLIIPLGLFGLVVGFQREDRARYLTWAAFVPAYALTVAGFFVSSRYRLPLLVPLVGAAGAAADWGWQRRSSVRHVRQIAGVLAALVVLFGAVNWPMQADNGRMFEREERIVRLVTDGEADEAKRLLADTEPDHPNRAALLYRVAGAFRDRGGARDAAEYFARALALNPNEPWIHLNLAQSLLAAGRPSEAIPHFETARAAAIDPVNATYGLAKAYANTEQRERADTTLASVTIVETTESKILLEMGLTAVGLRDLPLAERFFREAVRRTPGLATGHEHLGVVFGMQGRDVEAAAQFEQALAIDQSRPTAHFHLAVAYAQLGRFAEARVQAENAARLNPADDAARALLQRLPGSK
jgi:tetratricopeptide (TPR) repeat protein